MYTLTRTKNRFTLSLNDKDIAETNTLEAASAIIRLLNINEYDFEDTVTNNFSHVVLKTKEILN